MNIPEKKALTNAEKKTLIKLNKTNKHGFWASNLELFPFEKSVSQNCSLFCT